MNEIPIERVTQSDEILVSDPLRQYLGPESGNTVLGNYQEEDVPDEVLAVLDEFGLHSGKAFRVIIKELPDGVDDPAMGAFIKSFSRTVPTVDYLGRNFGPGRYALVFQWRARDNEQGKLVNRSERVLIEVSDKFEPEYREFQHKLKLERLRKRKESVQDAMLESKLEGSLLEDNNPENKQTAMAYVQEMLAFNEKLGLKRSGFDWEKFMPLLIAAIPAAMKAISVMGQSGREQQNQLMTLMLTQSNNYNNQLVEVMRNMGPQNGSDTMKEFREMLTSAIDMKELIHGEKKDSLADKIFSLVESVGPQLLQVAQMSAAARAVDPRVVAAKAYMGANPDFQALEANPESKSELIRRLDGYYGWQQTDAIMRVMGWERPGDCPRLPEQQYPADDGQTGDTAQDGAYMSAE